MQITGDGKVFEIDPCFAEEIRSASQQPIELCYHCQKCAAGCMPMAGFQDITPNQLIRMINLGLKEKVLKSPAIWLCTGCETCGARCPNGIRISEVIDAVREIAQVEKVGTDDRIPIFHRMFLDDIRSRGRISETFLMAKYKLRTVQLFNDLNMGLKLFLKGKLPLLPKGIKDKQNIKKIFSQAEEKAGRRHGSACKGGGCR